MNSSYTPLEGGSLSSLGVTAPTFGAGTDVSFFATTSFIYTLFFVFIIGAAFYRYMFAGIMRMQASDTAIRQSNDVIKKTTLGLLGVFSLFLILVTFNKDLVTGDVGLSSLAIKGVPVTSPPVTAPPVTPPVKPPASNSNYAARLSSHNSTVARLAPSNIHTNHGDAPCTEAQLAPGGKPSCTSLAFLPLESINIILKVNGDCHCLMVISGGTEPGHSSHGENLRPFDLRFDGAPKESSPLYIHLKNVGVTGSRAGCYITFKFQSFTFCDEKPPANASPTWAPHFHVF